MAANCPGVGTCLAYSTSALLRLQVDTIKDMSQQVQQQLEAFWMEGRLQQLAITLMQRFFPLTVGSCRSLVPFAAWRCCHARSNSP